VKKYLNKQDGKVPFYTEKISFTLPAEEKKMGLTRPKIQQVEKIQKSKDPQFYMMFLKSAIRIGACYALLTGNFVMAAIVFAIAEFVNIGHYISK
jgi:hypothetical protein